MFVLALRRYPELCADTSFVTGRGQRNRNIQLRPIVRALGAARTAALPGFHAWSGADVTGNFAFKGKLECWKVFLQADEDFVTALADLGSTILPTAGIFYAIEKLVCQLYQPKTIQPERSKVAPLSKKTGRIRTTTAYTSCSPRGH